MSTSPAINTVPVQLRISLALYLEKRIPPGQFLSSVLSNNLFSCIAFGDDDALDSIPTLVRWIDSKTPRVCHGSIRYVNAWLDHDALPGWTLSEKLLLSLQVPEWVIDMKVDKREVSEELG